MAETPEQQVGKALQALQDKQIAEGLAKLGVSSIQEAKALMKGKAVVAKKKPALKIKVGTDKPPGKLDLVITPEAVKKAAALQMETAMGILDSAPGDTFMGVPKKEILSKMAGAKTQAEAVQAVASKPDPTKGKGITALLKNPTQTSYLKIEQVKSQHGSIFTVLGTDKDGLKVSIRFWLQPPSEKGHTTIGFRLRVGDQAGGMTMNVRDHMRAKFPEYAASFGCTPLKNATGQPVYEHVSIDGAMDFNCEPWEVQRIMGMLVDKDFIEELWYVVLKLADGNFAMDRNIFGNWAVSSILDLLKGAKKPGPPPGKMKYKLGASGARLMTSDKTKLTAKKAAEAAGL
jgi:hypothetical protein